MVGGHGLPRGRLRGGEGLRGHAAGLAGEDKKLFDETLRDYRRAGLDLPKDQRDEVEKLRKQLTALETDFENNVTKATKPLKFTKAELEGVPEDFLSQQGIKTGDDEYTLKANITFHYIMVEDNAKLEATRKRMMIAQCNLAREENIPLLQKILVLRDDVAHQLGYASYADYATETRMVKNAATAIKFLENLKTGLQPKFDAELEEFRQLKIKETGDANAKINVWDWRYFANELKKTKYNVDAEQLRVYFPYQRVLDGLFAIYQRIFGLKFERVEAALQMGRRLAALHRFRRQDRRAAGPVLSRHVSARGQIQSLRPVRHHRGQAAAGRKISAPGLRARLQFPAAAAGQAVAHVARRGGDDLPRVRPRDAHDSDARQILALLRHQRAAGFRRGAVADAGKLAVGQERAGQLRGGLPRPEQKNSAGHSEPAQGLARWRRWARIIAGSFRSG